MARPAARQMSFADLELRRQGVRLEPLLRGICDFLDKQPALIARGRRDPPGRPQKAPEGSPRPHRVADVACTGSDAPEELGLSRAARTYRRWNNAAPVHRLLLR